MEDKPPKTLIELIRRMDQDDQRHFIPSAESSSIDKEVRRAIRIKNNNAISDQDMKEKSLKWLFRTLIGEVTAIFCLAFCQGFGGGAWLEFHIEEWCFALLVTGVFAQTVAIVIIAVKHLFPEK